MYTYVYNLFGFYLEKHDVDIEKKLNIEMFITCYELTGDY